MVRRLFPGRSDHGCARLAGLCRGPASGVPAAPGNPVWPAFPSLPAPVRPGLGACALAGNRIAGSRKTGGTVRGLTLVARSIYMPFSL